jgi:hemolysin activation/secretion protein
MIWLANAIGRPLRLPAQLTFVPGHSCSDRGHARRRNGARKAYKRIAYAFAFAVFASPAIAIAQTSTVPTLPGASDPGRTPDILRREPLEPEVEQVPVPGLPTPVPLIEDEEKFRGVLSEVSFAGNTVYGDPALRDHWEQLRGQMVTAADVRTLAAAITARYQGDGYAIVRAVPGPEGIQDGVLRMRVIEGFVESVVFEGEGADRFPLLRAYAEKLKASKPLKADALDRYLQLMNDLPGLAIQASLRAPPDPDGAETLVIQVSHKAVDYLGIVDNRGSRHVGPGLASAGVRLNSTPLQPHNQVSMRLFTSLPETRELGALEATALQPLGAEGTALLGSISLSRIRPGFTLKEFDIEGISSNVSISLLHPWLRGQRENVWLSVSFNYLDSNADAFNGSVKVFEDRVRALRLGVTYSGTDAARGDNEVIAEISQGLNLLRATTKGAPTLSRAAGRSDFSKVGARASRIQQLAHHWSALGAITGQYSFHSLLSSEEFGLGGPGFLRAYDPAEISGDHGAALKAEIRYENSWGEAVPLEFQFYGYYDLGAVWKKTSTANTDGRDSAAAAGLGVRFHATRFISGYAEVGWPLTRPVATMGNNQPRAFFGLVAQF